MARVGWRMLRAGSDPGAVLSVDFTLAKARAQAGFGELTPQLPGGFAVWATDESAWPRSPGVPAAQLAGWLRDGCDVDPTVLAVFGFCASASLAGALAGRLATVTGVVPAVVLFDPVAVGPRTMIDQAEESMRRLGEPAPDGDVDTGRAAVAPGDDDGADLGELATALAGRYAAGAAEAGAARSIPPSIVDQLCQRVEANLRFLTLCAAAWSQERAVPDLLVLSRDHRVPAPLSGLPEVRLDTTQDALLSHPDTARAAAQVLASRV